MSANARLRRVIEAISARPRRPGHPRRLGIGVFAVAAVAIVVAAFVAIGLSGGSKASDADAEDAPSAVATVEEGRLASQVTGTGTLGYAARSDGTPYAVINQAAGAYTQLPSVGDVIGCGEPLYRANGEPVALLCGRIPLYRPLHEGLSGADVRELNRNLVEIGYASRAEMAGAWTYFGYPTTAALEKLQDDLGIAETGSLEPGQAVFLPGPLRITRVEATLGMTAQPGSPVAQATSTRRRVQMDLDASQAGAVEAGDRARITLPDNATVGGEVTRVGTVVGAGADDSGSGGEAETAAESTTIPVYITLERANNLDAIDEAPVQVEITTGRVKQALSVPVTALLARAGGGYAVETVADGGERELLAVEIGEFDHANGLVRVSGSGLEAGQRVVVPAT